MSNIDTIPEFFANKTIFITGGLGFMGKVLIEKLLRSCSDLEMIYLVIRTKKGKTVEERWGESKELKVFDRLREERPGILEAKVKVLNGDLKQLRLGLSDDDYKELQEKVSIVFHCAASVRFNDPLPDAIFMNLRGSHEVLKMAVGMKKLKVFVHVSTTYCNCYLTETNETIYPAPADWRETIRIAENLDPTAVAILSSKYLGPFPNTYTFTKNLAERMMWDYREMLPIVIIRPSIVICSLSEPMPGWIDNLNGPLGLMLASGKGIHRVSYTDLDSVPDYMAVDVAIKAMIVAAWKKALTSECRDVSVYNAASRSKNINNGVFMKLAQKINYEYPLTDMLWYPRHCGTKSRFSFKFQFFLKQFIPAIVVDQLLMAIGRKNILLSVQIKIYNAMMALSYFTTKNWLFSNKNFLDLRHDILPQDKDVFDYYFDDIDVQDFIRMGIKTGIKFLLNEDESANQENKKKLARLYWIDRFCNFTAKFLFGYAVYLYFF